MQFELFTGLVLLDNKNQIYLIKEEDKNEIGQGKWNLPGGSVDQGETIIAAAQREALEETGYQATVKSFLGCYQGIKDKVSWLFLVLAAKTRGGKPILVTDPTVKEGHWFKKEEFLKMAKSKLVHSEMKEVYKLAINKKGLPLKIVRFS